MAGGGVRLKNKSISEILMQYFILQRPDKA